MTIKRIVARIKVALGSGNGAVVMEFDFDKDDNAITTVMNLTKYIGTNEKVSRG